MAWASKGSLKGPKGDKGDKGDAGEQGPKGDKGDTGAQGPQGDTGARGVGIRCGSGAPSGTAGAGELYIDTATGDLYEYEA